MKVWCLHGNLQLPSAWDQFEGRWLMQNAMGTFSLVQLCCPDLWEDGSSDFKEWAHSFCARAEQQSDGSPQWLMGYSLGGRLAMHAVLENPYLWSGVILIGAHPGFASVTEKKKQLEWDRRWAQRFLETPWHELLTAWDTLPVFCARTHTLLRPEDAFSREQVARCFEVFSKGKQDLLTPALSRLQMPPICFISGDEDVKYTEIGAQLGQACSVVTPVVIPDAGHRVPWENPEAFIKKIQVFLDSTS